jgi:hypothetical protein
MGTGHAQVYFFGALYLDHYGFRLFRQQSATSPDGRLHFQNPCCSF